MSLIRKFCFAFSVLLIGTTVSGGAFITYAVLSPTYNAAYWLSARFPIGFWYPENLPFQDAWIMTEDDTKLHGWFVPHRSPRAIVLFAHGSGGNLTWRAEVLRRLHDDLKLTTLIFDYRGYGRSEGKPSEHGIY